MTVFDGQISFQEFEAQADSVNLRINYSINGIGLWNENHIQSNSIQFWSGQKGIPDPLHFLARRPSHRAEDTLPPV
jgi:hypothetical protein